MGPLGSGSCPPGPATAALNSPRPSPHRTHMSGGTINHSRDDRRGRRRLAARPGAGRRGADPVARAAEGADLQRRGHRARAASRCAIRRSRRCPAAPTRSRSPSRGRRTTKPQDIALDIVFEDEHLLVVDKPAGHGRPSRRRQFRRHPGQRPAPPLRRAAVGDRRRGAAGHRPPHRQGHVRPARRRQDRRRA